MKYDSYQIFREKLLDNTHWTIISSLGAHGWTTYHKNIFSVVWYLLTNNGVK